MRRIGLTASEEMLFENVDDGRRTGPNQYMYRPPQLLRNWGHKNGFISNYIATLFKTILNGIFYFPLYAWCKKLYSEKVPYLILIQFKYFTLCHVCNTLDNKIILKQN